MKKLSTTYLNEKGEKKVKAVRVELTKQELEFVLSGLEHLHAQYANVSAFCEDRVESSRPISDLYYGLKY